MDESEFECLLGGDARTGTYEDTTKFGYSTQLLHQHDVLTAQIKNWMRNHKPKPLDEKDIKFLKNEKSLKHFTQNVFNKMEKWYITHVLTTRLKDKPGLKEHMLKLLMQDPVGTVEPDKNDPFCWTKQTVLTPAETNQSGDDEEDMSAPTRVTRATTAASTTTTTAAAEQQQPLITSIEYEQTDFLVQL